jgi:hypothetical protein
VKWARKLRRYSQCDAVLPEALDLLGQRLRAPAARPRRLRARTTQVEEQEMTRGRQLEHDRKKGHGYATCARATPSRVSHLFDFGPTLG